VGRAPRSVPLGAACDRGTASVDRAHRQEAGPHRPPAVPSHPHPKPSTARAMRDANPRSSNTHATAARPPTPAACLQGDLSFLKWRKRLPFAVRSCFAGTSCLARPMLYFRSAAAPAFPPHATGVAALSFSKLSVPVATMASSWHESSRWELRRSTRSSIR